VEQLPRSAEAAGRAPRRRPSTFKTARRSARDVRSGPTRIRAVLFDLGGTLIDERDFAGWAEMARGVYLDLAPDDFAHAYGEVEDLLDREPLAIRGQPAVVERWRRVLSLASGGEVAPETAARFVAARALDRDHPVALYSDARRCLDRLASERRRLAVVSNSTSEASVRRILDRVGILGYFEKVVSSGSEGVAKPDPEIFRRALERLKVLPEEALYVGNLLRTDAVAAREAGMHSVWLHRDGTGLGEDPPEIISLLELPLLVRQLETAPARAPAAHVK
jgi:putative hydrolase of the HAD superfamily